MATIYALLAGSDAMAFAVDVAVKTSLVFVAAAVAVRLLGHRSSAARHRVWALAFGGALVVPALAALVPRVAVPILPSSAERPVAARSLAVTPAQQLNERPSSNRPSTLRDESETSAAAPSPGSASAQIPRGPSTTTRRATAATTPAPSVGNITVWLLAFWAAGFAISQIPLLQGTLRQRRLLATARGATKSAPYRLLHELCEQLALRRHVRLFMTGQDVIPMTWGFVRPLIVLPETASRWTHQRQRMVLLHELAHITRLDLPVQWLARITCAVYWFNPFAWYAFNCLRDECEQACDDWVLQRGEPASRYASELVDLAEAHYVLQTAAAVAMARTHRLESRIRAIVDSDRSRAPLTRVWTCGSLAAASCLVLCAAVLQPVAGRAQAQPTASDAATAPATNDPSKPQGPGLDAVGDPVPQYALLGFGTQRFRPPTNIDELALSPDEKTVVTLSSEYLIAWDTVTGKERWRKDFTKVGVRFPGAGYGLRLIAFTPDSKQFYTPAMTNEVMLWDVESGIGERIMVRPGNTTSAQPVAIDLTPDGKLLVLGNERGVVVREVNGKILYEVPNRPKKRIGIENGNGVRDRLMFGGDYSFVRFSPDGKLLAIANSEFPEEIRLVAADTGNELSRIALKSRLVRLAFSPDSARIVATERDSAVRMYNIGGGARLWEHVVKLNNPFENYTSAIAFSPDGKTIAAAATDQRIHLLNSDDGSEAGELRGHVWYPWCLAFAADSKLLYSSGWDATIRRWDVPARKQLELPAGVHASPVVAASPDGRTLAYGDDRGRIHLVSAADGRELRALQLLDTRFSDFTFSPDGRQLAGGGISGTNFENVHVTLFDVATGNLVQRWEWPEGKDPHSEAEGLQFSPTGDRLAAAVFRQGKAFIWDLTTGQQIAELPHDDVYGLSFTPDGETLATAGWDSAVRFWSAATGEPGEMLDVKKRLGGDGDWRMYNVCYAPEGDLFATAHIGDGNVRVWNSRDMSIRAQFRVPTRFIYSAIAFSPDGLWLATGSQSGEVTVWDPLSGDKVWNEGRHLDSIYKLQFTPDGGGLFTGGSDGLCYLWSIRDTGGREDANLDALWQELVGDDSFAAFQAGWALAAKPQQIAPLLAQKLHSPPFTGAKQSKLEQSVLARRAVSLLIQGRCDASTTYLKQLAGQDPNTEIARHAAAALHRLNRLSGN